MNYCNCHATMPFVNAIKALKDKVVEFIQDPSLDEFSDVVYCVNRMVGSIVNKPYVKILPGDGLHISKINKRMRVYDCIRSRNHLTNGRCPSRNKPTGISVIIGNTIFYK